MQLVATPQGVGMWVSVPDWKAILKYIVDINKDYDRAEACGVP